MKPHSFNDVLAITKGKSGLVIVTGIFDILHIEHIRFLQKAKAAGEYLVVGIERDDRVKKIKGEHRPIHNQNIRCEQIIALSCVDNTFLLPEAFSQQQDWEDFMQQLSPSIYAVSSHTQWLDNKRQIAEKYGAKLAIVHQFNPDISTTSIEEKLRREI